MPQSKPPISKPAAASRLPTRVEIRNQSRRSNASIRLTRPAIMLKPPCFLYLVPPRLTLPREEAGERVASVTHRGDPPHRSRVWAVGPAIGESAAPSRQCHAEQQNAEKE